MNNMNLNKITLSLNLHLFFDRIMKEHAIFIEASLPEKNKKIKKIANEFQLAFADLLNQTIDLTKNLKINLSNELEWITQNTKLAEEKTIQLTGIKIQTNLTEKEQELIKNQIKNQNKKISMRNIEILNKQTLAVLNNFIGYKQQLLTEVLNGKVYTTNYPSLIEHMLKEAKMYHILLHQIQYGYIITQNDLYQQELFWNKVMQEHAEVIRGYLDPKEEQLIKTANQYAKEYQNIIINNNNNLIELMDQNRMITINFRNFNITLEEKIIHTKIKSIILPLLADHLVREANHLINLLEKR